MEDELLSILESANISLEKGDEWGWSLDTFGIYSTNSAYKHLEKQDLELQNQPLTDLEVYKLLWKSKIPSKVLAFTWQLFKGRLPTKMNLLRRGVLLALEEQRCVFCNRSAENEDHLFVSCDFSFELWNRVYGWMNCYGAQPGSIQQHFLQHRGMVKGKERKHKVVFIWHAVVWTIWLERNGAIFNKNKSDLVRVIDLV